MKKIFKKILVILEKPKLVIPVALILAIAIGVVSYNSVGQMTNVLPDELNPDTSSVLYANGSISLAFPKTGRLGNLSVSVGSHVKKGEVLASLDAGDALGAVNQAKGALELAKAQYASTNVQYSNVKKQQDVLVQNAYRTLLSSSLSAVPQNKYSDDIIEDNSQIPQITGTYTCDKEGRYVIKPYASAANSGYSFNYSGLETGTGSVAYYTAQPLGSCGLFIQFPTNYLYRSENWIIDVPNTISVSYVANKNAYDLALATRDQTLKQLEASLGQDNSGGGTLQASITAAEGVYQTALAAYKNNLIVAPVDGVVSFVDPNLKVGQLIAANKTIISISDSESQK